MDARTDASPSRAVPVAANPPETAAPASGGGVQAQREIGGVGGGLVSLLAIAIALVHIYFNTVGVLPELWMSAIHFGGLALLGALLFPIWRGAGSGRSRGVVLACDIVIGLLAAASAAYVILFEEALYERGVELTGTDATFGVIAILTAMEVTRRTTGWLIPLLVVAALTYVTWWGRLLAGPLHFPGLGVDTLLYRSYFSSEGMFGMIAEISATYVFMFILFGAFLMRSGAGDFIIQLARCAAGRFVGGPGLVAVAGSGMMGSISGSAVANTVSTGVLTIPLMKRAGFSPRFAAGVETAASTGGPLMPPIMGAGAFIMASYTQLPYVQIIAVAFLPAVMYFLAVAFWVRIEAKRLNLPAGMADAPRLGQVLREGGHAIVPIAVLIGMLIRGFTPTYAAATAILATVAASWVSPRPMGPRAIVACLNDGSRHMVTTGVLLVTVGLITNVVTTAGLGNTLAMLVADWAGGSLVISLVLVAIASLVLGVGLPATAAYVVLAALAAPALNELIQQHQLVNMVAAGNVPEAMHQVIAAIAPDQIAALGSPMSRSEAAAIVGDLPRELMDGVLADALTPAALTAALLSAHMIIFWLSQDSNVTPPVCLAAFTAAAVAGARPMATGLTAWKIAKGLYILPFLFAFTPLVGGTAAEVLPIVAFGIVGIYALLGAIEGHTEWPLPWPLRLVLAAAGSVLLWPSGVALSVAGLVLFAAAIAVQRWLVRGRRW